MSSVVSAGVVQELPLLKLIKAGGDPEDVLVASDGSVFTGLNDGRIVQIEAAIHAVRTVADTGARPLGMEWLPDGRILVCDSERGLLTVSVDNGKVQTLPAVVDGRPVGFCNNPAVAADGCIYFSESSMRYGIEHSLYDLIENRPTGRLLRLSPGGRVEVLLQRLHFANGVAVAPQDEFVVVAESPACRLTRYWLRGAKQGASDVFAQLPGMPDNISVGSDGLLWVAIPSPRSPQLEALHSKPLWLRWLAARAAHFVVSPVSTPFLVMAFSFDGKIVHHFAGQHESLRTVTGVREHKGTVYLAAIDGDTIARFEVPQLGT